MPFYNYNEYKGGYNCMNGISLVYYIENFKSDCKEELSSLYYRLSDYCLEHLLKYELIILTKSPLDVSEITQYFRSKNIKNNIRVYKCNEKFSKVAEFTITVGVYDSIIILDAKKYLKETVGLELMLTDFIKYETPCCIGLFRDNNVNYTGLIGVAFKRDYIYNDIDKLSVININELFRQLLNYFSYIGVALRYNGINSSFKLYEITITFKLVEKFRKYRFISNVKRNYYRAINIERQKYKTKGRKKYDNL